MQFSVALLAVLASTVSAVSLVSRQDSPLPDCAMTCILGSDFDGCQPTDNNCLCRSERFIDTSTRCILSTCTGEDLQFSMEFSQGVCRSVGVTLTSTPVLETETSAGTGTATSPATTATSPATTATPPTTTATSPTTTATSPPNTSGASNTNSGSTTTTGTGSPSTETNAASVHGVSAFAGLAALGLAALAL